MSDGDCFVVAAGLALADHRLTLVHGKPTGRGGDALGLVYWHAWCETEDGMVIDRSNGRNIEMPVGVYYMIGRINADECLRYTIDETFAELRTYHHYGPWNGEYPPHVDDDEPACDECGTLVDECEDWCGGCGCCREHCAGYVECEVAS
jgi:hypothetical protein